jgi:hypothetical protein
MAQGQWTLGVLGAWGGHENVLVEYRVVTDPLLWVRAEGVFPVPENCELPLKRYQLRRDLKTGKEAFWPIVHKKDAAEENAAASVVVNPAFVADALLKLNKGEKLSAASEKVLADYLASMDAQGATKQ